MSRTWPLSHAHLFCKAMYFRGIWQKSENIWVYFIKYLGSYIYTYIYTYMCVYIYTYMCVCIYTYTHIYMQTYIHTYMRRQAVKRVNVLFFWRPLTLMGARIRSESWPWCFTCVGRCWRGHSFCNAWFHPLFPKKWGEMKMGRCTVVAQGRDNWIGTSRLTAVCVQVTRQVVSVCSWENFTSRGKDGSFHVWGQYTVRFYLCQRD